MYAIRGRGGSSRTVSAIIIASYTKYYKLLVPQVPSDITTLPTYDQNGQLSQLNIQWSIEVIIVCSLGCYTTFYEKRPILCLK